MPFLVVPEKFHGPQKLFDFYEHGKISLPADVEVGECGFHHLEMMITGSVVEIGQF